MPVDRSKAQDALAWIVSRRGGEARVVNKLEQMTEGPLSIPFLSPTLTWATTGGVRIGHFNRWYGPEGSGKSLTNWGLAYVAQNYPAYMDEFYGREIRYWERRKKKFAAVGLKKRLRSVHEKFPDGLNVMLFDTEQRADSMFGERIGVNMDEEHCALIEQNVIEEIINEIKGSLDAYHIFIVDSVSNAQSYQEANLDPGDYERGTAAAAWKRLRQVRRNWDRTENALILVDQMRMQLGQRQARAAPSQIRFIKHNISLDVEFDRGTKLYLNRDHILTDDKDKASDDYRAMGSDGKSVAGLEMKCFVAKNSTGKPFRNALMRFRFDVTNPATGELVQEMGFDQAYELMKIGEYFRVLEFGGGGMVYLLNDRFERTSSKWKGEWRVMKALAEDQDLVDHLLTRIAIDI